MSRKSKRGVGLIPIVPKGRADKERTVETPKADPHGSIKPLGSIFDHPLPRAPREAAPPLETPTTVDIQQNLIHGAGSIAAKMLSKEIPKQLRHEALIPVGGEYPNRFAVGVNEHGIVIMGQAQGMHTREEALNLAAYIVAMSGGLVALIPVLKGVEDAI